MSAVLQVRIPGRPVAWSRTGGGGGGHRWNTAAHESWAAFAALHMRQAMSRQGRVDGAVEVRFLALLERPAYLTPSARHPHPRGRLPAAKTPDVDNVGKLVLDALKRAAVIRDDAQVVRLIGEKAYAALSETPCVWVEMRLVDHVAELGAYFPADL